MVASLNHALSGHSNTSADLQVWDAPGIHFGFMLPWSQVLSWHMYNQPWFQGEKLCALFKFYAKLRYRLLPYLYSLASEAHRAGMPMMRPMPLAFPDDPQSDGLLTQYMLGGAFLASSFSDTVYLPEGGWIDYWTGERHVGPKTVPAAFPDDRGGPLFVRVGAIIPMGPDVAFSGQKPLDVVILDVYAGGDGGSFTLYEDDGESLDHLKGEFATTLFELSETAKTVTLTIHPRQGSYQGMPEKRTYVVNVRADKKLSVKTPGVKAVYQPDEKTLSIEGVEGRRDKIAIAFSIRS